MAVLLLILSLILFPCNSDGQNRDFERYGIKVEETLAHDASSYTQGLFFHNGQLYESSGRYGESCFRKVDLKSGKVIKRINFGKNIFAEGACVLNCRFYILSWQESTCFVYDVKTLKELGRLHYLGEGWGLTTDGKELIMSDGSSQITFRDPENFAVRRSITVTLGGKEVDCINELEYIEGEIWANIYTTDLIVRIDPESGKVKAVIDCTGLLPNNLRKPSTDVLNGIAYDYKNGSVYLTGKYWPKMYRISLVPASGNTTTGKK